MEPDDVVISLFERLRECVVIGMSAPAVEKTVGIIVPVVPEAEKGIEFECEWEPECTKSAVTSIKFDLRPIRTVPEATLSFDAKKLLGVWSFLISFFIRADGTIRLEGTFDKWLFHVTILPLEERHGN